MSRTGVVKNCHRNDRGDVKYSFIIPDQAGTEADIPCLREGRDVFAHCENVVGLPLSEGDHVHFEDGWDRKKDRYCAREVTGGTGGAQVDPVYADGSAFSTKELIMMMCVHEKYNVKNMPTDKIQKILKSRGHSFEYLSSYSMLTTERQKGENGKRGTG